MEIEECAVKVYVYNAPEMALRSVSLPSRLHVTTPIISGARPSGGFSREAHYYFTNGLVERAHAILMLANVSVVTYVFLMYIPPPHSLDLLLYRNIKDT